MVRASHTQVLGDVYVEAVLLADDPCEVADPQYIDDVSGDLLDPNLVQMGRAEELEIVNEMGVREKMTRARGSR